MAHGPWRGSICNGLATEDELQPKLCDVPKESHFMRQRNVLVMATLPLLGLSLMVGSVGASGGANRAPAPPSTVSVPLPPELGGFRGNPPPAVPPGKAPFLGHQARSNSTPTRATSH